MIAVGTISFLFPGLTAALQVVFVFPGSSVSVGGSWESLKVGVMVCSFDQ